MSLRKLMDNTARFTEAGFYGRKAIYQETRALNPGTKLNFMIFEP